MSHTLGPPPGLDLSALPEPPWLHRIAPCSRIVAATGFAFFVVLLEKISVLLGAVGVGLFMVALARLPWIATLKRTLGVDLFILFLLLLLPFTTPGEVWLTLGPFHANWEGFVHAVRIGLRAMGVLLTLLALVGTLEPPELGYGLTRLGVPDKLVQILFFTVRYLDVLQREYQRLRIAMKARAFVATSSRHTWRSLGYLFGMLLVRSLERSERILAAMKCRGFVGRFHVLSASRIGAADGQFGGLLLLILTGLGLGEWG